MCAALLHVLSDLLRSTTTMVRRDARDDALPLLQTP